MSAPTEASIPTSAATTQVYRVYIKVGPQAVWDAITQPEWTNRYGYTGYAAYELHPHGSFQVAAGDEMKAAAAAAGYPCPDIVVDGEVIEADPPHRLVQTWRMLMDPGIAGEGFTRLTYELVPIGNGTRLTLTHDMANAPLTAAMVAGPVHEPDSDGGGGWAWVLSDLKSLLETGSGLAG